MQDDGDTLEFEFAFNSRFRTPIVERPPVSHTAGVSVDDTLFNCYNFNVRMFDSPVPVRLSAPVSAVAWFVANVREFCPCFHFTGDDSWLPPPDAIDTLMDRFTATSQKWLEQAQAQSQEDAGSQLVHLYRLMALFMRNLVGGWFHDKEKVARTLTCIQAPQVEINLDHGPSVVIAYILYFIARYEANTIPFRALDISLSVTFNVLIQVLLANSNIINNDVAAFGGSSGVSMKGLCSTRDIAYHILSLMTLDLVLDVNTERFWVGENAHPYAKHKINQYYKTFPQLVKCTHPTEIPASTIDAIRRETEDEPYLLFPHILTLRLNEVSRRNYLHNTFFHNIVGAYRQQHPQGNQQTQFHTLARFSCTFTRCMYEAIEEIPTSNGEPVQQGSVGTIFTMDYFTHIYQTFLQTYDHNQTDLAKLVEDASILTAASPTSTESSSAR